jgi:hypothetical protein
MRDYPLPNLVDRPSLVLAYEVRFDADADLRCHKRARIEMNSSLDFPATIAEIAKGSSNQAINWRSPDFKGNQHQQTNGKWPRSLSIGMRQDFGGHDDFAYVVILLKDTVRKVRFSVDHAPFSAGTATAQDYLFEPRVVVRLDGSVGVTQLRQPEVALANAPRGMATFIVDRRNYPDHEGDLPFNIHLEVLGKVGNVDYRTPIIIDPDLRWPPEGGGIPTYP